MAFLKVNCKEPVESISASSLLLFSHGCFESLCNTIGTAHL